MFKNDPHAVAKMFQRELNSAPALRGRFTRVVFALPRGSPIADKNFNAFNAVFADTKTDRNVPNDSTSKKSVLTATIRPRDASVSSEGAKQTRLEVTGDLGYEQLLGQNRSVDALSSCDCLLYTSPSPRD